MTFEIKDTEPTLIDLTVSDTHDIDSLFRQKDESETTLFVIKKMHAKLKEAYDIFNDVNNSAETFDYISQEIDYNSEGLEDNLNGLLKSLSSHAARLRQHLVEIQAAIDESDYESNFRYSSEQFDYNNSVL